MENKTQIQKKTNSQRRLWTALGWGTALFFALYLAVRFTTIFPAFLRVPPAPPVSASERDDRWQQDLNYLANQLKRLHVNPFHTVTAQEFDQAVAQLEAEIPQLDDDQVMLGILKIAALIGDGHTQASSFSDTLPPAYYPLRLEWFQDEAYAISSSQAYSQTVGSKLVQVDSTPITDLVTELGPYISADNIVQKRLRSSLFLVNVHVLRALRVTSSGDEATFIFESQSGERQALKLHPVGEDEFFEIWGNVVERDPLPIFLHNSDDYYWYEYLPEDRTIYFVYNRCADMKTRSFATFVEGLFEFIDQNEVERLVVDLRNNGGGSSDVFSPFLEKLEQHPLNQKGPLYVIIGRGTFSSAILNANELTRKAKVIFVGEETAGSPSHYGELKTFVLPNSGMRVSYATKYFSEQAADPSSLKLGDALGAFGMSLPQFPVSKSPDVTIVPDVEIEMTIEDFLTGKDRALTYILARK